MACGMMGQGGMMGRGMMGGAMMGRGMMGAGGMGPPIMMRMIFALMDSDGDGTIELPEFQAAHERIFKAMDSNKDGRLTQEEMQAFMRGTRSSASPR
jgi:Ca2+-binding EF-hand superfamily protein